MLTDVQTPFLWIPLVPRKAGDGSESIVRGKWGCGFDEAASNRKAEKPNEAEKLRSQMKPKSRMKLRHFSASAPLGVSARVSAH